MRYFANPSSARARDAMAAGLIDVIETPKQGNVPVDGAVWCADNGCFGKGYPGDEEWFRWLEANSTRAGTCVFAVAPDVVGDAAATLTRSAPWLPRIRELGYPAAFVAQDGLEDLVIPWDTFDVLFIGGSTEWKLGPQARAVVSDAKARGKWVHMGRVNSLKRLRYADAIGCDSADGTYLTYAPDANLPDILNWVREVNGQGDLFSHSDWAPRMLEAAASEASRPALLPPATPSRSEVRAAAVVGTRLRARRGVAR